MTTNLRPPTPDPRLPPAPSPLRVFASWRETLFHPALPVLHALHGEKIASPRPPSSRNGVALLITLGLLTVLAMLVIGFTLSVRWDRLSARNYRDRVATGHYADMGDGLSMETVDNAMEFYDLDTKSRIGVRFYPSGSEIEGWWAPTNEYPDLSQTRSCMGSLSDSPTDTLRLFTGSVTSMVPASLWKDARSIDSGWVPITNSTESSGSDLAITNGRVAFLILDVSGFLDVHSLRTNELAVLPERANDVDATGFLNDREIHLRYYSLPDIAANKAINPPVSNLFWTSYDPGPEVYWTNWFRLGTREVELLNCFPLNEMTNYTSQGTTYSGDPDFSKYFDLLTNHLAQAGFDEVNKIGWNIVNALDEDRIPQTDTETPWRDPYGFEAVPLINEFALFEVPSDEHDTANLLEPELPPELDPDPEMRAVSTNHYALAVELWYPFAPNDWEADQAQLVVGVFTNKNESDDFATANDANIGDFGFLADIPTMEFDLESPDRQFAVLPSPSDNYVNYVNFPVEIRKYRHIDGTGQAIEDWEKIDTDREYLPLGAFEYDRNVSVTPNLRYPIPEIQSGINKIFFQARVRVRDNDGAWHWVDEAFSDETDPDETGTAPRSLVPFTETGSVSIDDPLRNSCYTDPSGDKIWETYPLDQATLDGFNTNCAARTAGSFGLPLRHVDGPFTHPKHIGWVASTSAWSCIDFTTSEGARLLDVFTVGETNAPARGLVNVGTPHRAVIRAILADATIGWEEKFLEADDLNILADAFFEGRKRLDTDGFGALSFGGIQLDWGSGPISYPGLMTAIGETVAYQEWNRDNPAAGMKQDVLAHLADRLSFRQQMYVIVTAAQTLSPRLRVTAEQRAVAVILRDAYTGRWQILRQHSLPD